MSFLALTHPASPTTTVKSFSPQPQLTLRRKLIAVLAIVLALVTVSTVAAGPAQASIYAGGGNFGGYWTPIASCQWKIYGPSSNLVMSAGAPTVFAHNSRAGGGNDSAWVRYRVFVVNANTGATISSSGYSAWSAAYDNKSAVWAGGPTVFTQPSSGQYYIDYRIEWNVNGSTAWAADRVSSYHYYDQYNVGPFGKAFCTRL